VSFAVAALTFGELKRVESGKLFLLALPGERAASEFEVFDARQSAAAYRYPAIGAVLALGIVIGWLGPRVQSFKLFSYSVAMLAIFGIAVVADMVTTIRFFYASSVADELHPG